MLGSTNSRLPSFVCEDVASRTLQRRIAEIAPSTATVLITGETGTGKEIVARHVHALSRRSSSSFGAVNCSALPETLIESEFFGHERGAFTGAARAKAGWFESAHGGTLFLDEIGELPLGVQVKLLRVLQEGEVVRLGSRRPIPIDVRIIAATNVRLDRAVEERRFREDLYYRLHVAPLDIPPLRQRAGDIMPLARHFLDLYRIERGNENIAFSSDAERRLLQHTWPGNVRELENAIRRALLSCRDEVLTASDLSLPTMAAAAVVAPAPSPLPFRAELGASTPATFNPLESVLATLFEANGPELHARIEQSVFCAAFRYCHRNQLQTARLLGVSRNVVRARLLEAGELTSAARMGRVGAWNERPVSALGGARRMFIGDHFPERTGQTDWSARDLVAER